MKQKAALFLCFILATAALYGQGLSADFKSDITSGCSPIIVNFQDLSQGGAKIWKWDFGNGATSSKQNPSTTYFDPGTYTITLTIFNADETDSSKIVKTAYITVFDPPQAEFVSDKQSGCSPYFIQFSDLSTSPFGTTIKGWKWEFGDGGVSTEQNPRYNYKRAGSYTVTLTITNDQGCTKLITKPNYINIIQGVVPNFTFIDPMVCMAPATYNFTNRSTGPGNLTYSWSLGNGATANTRDASTTYAVNGNYKVSLIVSSDIGCMDSVSQVLEVGKAVTDFITPAVICPKTNIAFLNNSTPRPISSQWEFSTGFKDNTRNTSTSFPTAGTYTVTLVNVYAVCTDTLEKTITVADGPTINFSAVDTFKCQPPFTVNFNNSSNGSSYKWDFGDGTTSTAANPSHTYTSYGEFDVTLVATGPSGCNDTLRMPKYIKITKPTITIPSLPTQGCIPFPFTFKANAATNDQVISYKWDFGDGGTSTAPTPTYTYTKEGTYNLTLTVTTKTGCTEIITLDKAVKVGAKPKAGFSGLPRDVCASQAIEFKNESSVPTDEWLWLFGDGTRSTAENPKHEYSDTGKLDVTLIAYNHGCGDTLVKKQYVNIKPPVSKFSYRPDCANQFTYTFTDKSLAPLTWEWKINNQTFTGKTPPPYTFPGFGTYTVSLTTTNGSCTHTYTENVVIRDQTPDFTADNREGCKPFSPTLTAKPPVPGIIKNYSWDFGDGKLIDGGASPSKQFTYPAAGNYYVKLVTTDTFGCKHQVTKDSFIRVNGPDANFTSTTNTGCKGLTATFIDSTKTDGINAIVKWEWDFGDGKTQTYTAPPFQHSYDSVGDYDVSMTVTDAKGCTSKKTYRQFVVISTLKVDWTVSPASCPGSALMFRNLTKSDLPYSSFWEFGDSTTFNTKINDVQHAFHAYKDTGIYTVKLKVRDIFACEDSLIKQNIVKIALPKASFDANNFTSYCTPFEAKFQNTSYFYESSLWNLSTGTSTQTNPTNYYTTTGTFPIKLVVTSPGGCKDSATNTVKVYNPSDAKITYAPLKGCTPVTVDLEAFSPMKAQFVWDMGDGNVITTDSNKFTHTYVDFGNFVPKIILKEPSGKCIVPLTGDKVIGLKGIKAKYRLDKNFFCDSGTVRINDSTTFNDPVVSYHWDMGDGTTYSIASPGTHYYKNPGIYNVTFYATTETGCSDTLRQGPVKIVQSPDISVKTDTVICVNERLLHTGIMERPDTSILRWQWFFPNGNTSQLQNPVPQQYVTAGSFPMKTYAFNSSGCADSVTKMLHINPLPTATLPSTLTTIVGTPVQIPATYSSGVRSYTWEPAATLSCTTCPEPIASPKFNTRYTVSYVDSNGCRNNSIVQVIVICKGATVFVPNTFSPNGDGANDVFYVRGKGLDRVKSLRIFNRWGEVVFEQKDFPVNNPAYGWDGKYKGNNPIPDVYVYQVEIFCENSEIIRFDGNVALIK
ncbi:PKD domain-containing protein [Flavisolibacter tropicus]|uniref:PKD domain-containing protein n=1 Tax=Flavisolibacter tropicus TaxID=1492898 RepID=A0A172TVA2_9BACT|nr:PKD domain-containing protein [Flavisolibacter tropicus]ANE50713.1 hypothetical protein SY85_09575 [Flavisolibacter tropicus]